MSHPHQFLLEEYQVAINHLTPSVPEEIKKDAQAKHDALLANPAVSEAEIQAAMIATGKAEYPHRQAYQELMETLESERLLSLLLARADEGIRRKLVGNVASSSGLQAFIHGPLFETVFTPAERVQVHATLSEARQEAQREMLQQLAMRQDAYTQAVAKWQAQSETVEDKIAELETLADENLKWREEILNKAARFREGFSVTAPDPTLGEIQSEIENWKGTLEA